MMDNTQICDDDPGVVFISAHTIISLNTLHDPSSYQKKNDAVLYKNAFQGNTADQFNSEITRRQLR